MLDTIILELPIDPIANVIDFNQFGTTKEAMQKCTLGFHQWKNNPTSADWKAGIYKPRLTVNKRGNRFYLKIEFSAPKMLFCDNLNELEEKDFEPLLSKLNQRLQEMGVKIFRVLLEKANTISFHPSKNILLSNGYTSIFAIRELSKIDISKKFDITKIKYRNGGEELQIYTISNSLVFYDKINDLSKPAKRANDKDQTLKQFTLFEEIKKQKRPIEVLRMEARPSKKQKMNEVLAELGYPQNPTFKDIFNKELCQKILLSYWERFFSDNLFLFDMRNDEQNVFQSILANHSKNIGIHKAIYLTGLYMLCKDEAGMRGFRNIAEIYKPKTNWTKLKKWLAPFQSQIATTPLHGFIKDIEQQLKDFKPYKLPKNPK